MSDTFTIGLQSGDAFSANADENLLAAAQRAHWLVRYGCRNGNCEACAATLLRGCVTQRGQIIDAAQHPQSTILLCLCHALTDLHIQLPIAPQHGSREQSQRRYARLMEYEETPERWWRIKFALPAGRQPAFFAGQYLEIESVEIEGSDGKSSAHPESGNAQRVYIDAGHSSGRTLCAIGEEKPDAAPGDHVHLRYPLGYCYAAAPLPEAVILFERGHRIQALQLQTCLAAQSGRAPALIEIANDNISVTTQLNTTIFACAPTIIARYWFEKLLASSAQFAEFRCDDAVWRRWQVKRQDDNGNRFIVATGLGESAARALADEMERRGHKQLYWAEPLM